MLIFKLEHIIGQEVTLKLIKKDMGFFLQAHNGECGFGGYFLWSGKVVMVRMQS